jgi:hypothetical protein
MLYGNVLYCTELLVYRNNYKGSDFMHPNVNCRFEIMFVGAIIKNSWSETCMLLNSLESSFNKSIIIYQLSVSYRSNVMVVSYSTS